MKVGVIMGGVSAEGEVSLMTGKEMVAHLDKQKYEVYPIELTEKTELIGKVEHIDVALLALHGKYGEDGTIQGTLDTLGIPYTGSGLLASSLCMNKDVAKKLLRFEGIRTPDWILLKKSQGLSVDEAEQLGYPVVVKPNSSGSSIGVKIVGTREALIAAVEEAFQWDAEVMIEQYIKGEEITCPMLNGELLPIVSIRPNADFFDYTAKYADGGADEQVIQLPDEMQERVRGAAHSAYEALKCSVYARIDMILRDGIPYVLEVNSLPGLTKNSLLPKSAQAAGIPFSRLLDLIIEYSLEERKAEGR